MKTELESALASEFPFMKRSQTLREQKEQGCIFDLYGAFGCDCGDGWFEVLKNLSIEITAAYEENNTPVDLVVDQVKEKFGTLRFYFHRKGQDPGIQAFDCLGGPSIRFASGRSEFDRRISEIVWKWEKLSGEVCERCGKTGRLRKNLPWVQTLCASCYCDTKKQYALRGKILEEE